MGGQDAHPTIQFTLCGTGILPVLDNGTTFFWAGRMPTPQASSLFVEQASCLFLGMVQHLNFNKDV